MIEVVVVKQYNADKVKAAVKQNIPVVILFRMDGCPHCDFMRPAWEACKKKLTGKQGEGCVAEVEYGDMNSLPSFMKIVRGFPSLMVFKKNSIVEYSGDRSEDSLTTFVKQHMIPPRPKSAPVQRKAAVLLSPKRHSQPIIKPHVKPNIKPNVKPVKKQTA